VIVAIALVAGWVTGAQGEEPSPTPVAAGPVTIGDVAPVEMHAGASSVVHVPVWVADGHRVQANPASNEFLVPLELEISDHDGLVFGTPVYPRAEPYLLEGADESLMTYVGEFEVFVPVAANADAAPGEHIVPGELHYQACNSRMCLFPESIPFELRVIVSEPGEAPKKEESE
jgi:hypothetical protein